MLQILAVDMAGVAYRGSGCVCVWLEKCKML